MQKMITVIRLSRPQPPGLIFTPPLPLNFGRKATGVRFKQAASIHISSENSNMDKQQEEPTLKLAAHRQRQRRSGKQKEKRKRKRKMRSDGHDQAV
ncbi:hypothetical protein PS1_005463 [Malus domestica]